MKNCNTSPSDITKIDDFLLYGDANGNVKVEIYIFGETIWLTQDKIAHTATDGKNYKTKFYNLDAILSVGYRVNSIQAMHFRIWAT